MLSQRHKLLPTLLPCHIAMDNWTMNKPKYAPLSGRTQDIRHKTQDTGHRTQDTGHGTWWDMIHSNSTAAYTHMPATRIKNRDESAISRCCRAVALSPQRPIWQPILSTFAFFFFRSALTCDLESWRFAVFCQYCRLDFHNTEQHSTAYHTCNLKFVKKKNKLARKSLLPHILDARDSTHYPAVV